MKKIKFAAQVTVLILAFPVLFITGISHGSTSPVQTKEQNESIRKEIKTEKSDRLAGCSNASFFGTAMLINCIN